MGLFSKKKREGMELPPPPPATPAEEEGFELPELPPLPEEPADKDLFSELPELPPLPEDIEMLGGWPKKEEIIPPKPKEISVPVEKQLFPKKEPLQPLFISVDDYRFVMEGIERIKRKILESQEAMELLEKLKKDEEKLLEEWKTKILDIEKKLSYVDKAVLKAER